VLRKREWGYCILEKAGRGVWKRLFWEVAVAAVMAAAVVRVGVGVEVPPVEECPPSE